MRGILRALLVAIVAAPLVWVPGVYRPFTLPGSVLVRLLVAVGFVVAATGWLRGWRPRVGKDPILLTLAGFVGVYLLAGLAGLAPVKSLFGTVRRLWGGLAWLHLAGLYLLLRTALSEDDWRRLLGASVGVGSLVALLALLPSPGWGGELFHGAGEGGLLGNPGLLAGYLVLDLGLAGLLWRRADTSSRLLLAVGIGLHVAGLVASGARAGWAAVGVGIVVALGWEAWVRTREGRDVRVLLAVLGLLVAGGAMGITRIDDRLLRDETDVTESDLERVRDRSLAERLMFWDVAARTVRDRPVRGIGPENFAVAWQERLRPQWYGLEWEEGGRLAFQNRFPDRPHNAFLRAFVETGVVGGLLYLTLFSVFTGLVMLAAAPGGRLREEGPWLLGTVAAYGAYLLFWFETWAVGVLFIVLLAYAMDRREEAGDGRSQPPERSEGSDRHGRGPAWAAAGGSALLLVVSVVYHAELVRAARATVSVMSGSAWQERLAGYTRAVTSRPAGTGDLAVMNANLAFHAATASGQRPGNERLRAAADSAVHLALVDLRRAIRHDPENAWLRVQEAGIHQFGTFRLHGDAAATDRAIQGMQRAIEMAPDVLLYRHQLAQIYLQVDRPEQAVDVLYGAVRRYDGWARTHLLLAQAQVRAGKDAMARASLGRAAELSESAAEDAERLRRRLFRSEGVGRSGSSGGMSGGDG